MIAAERVEIAMRGGMPDRTPFIPKIWVDLAARLEGVSLIEVIENPMTAMEVIPRAAHEIGADGARLFLFPARKTERADGAVWEVGSDGKRIGKIDMEGGLATHVDDPSMIDFRDPVRMAHLQFMLSDRPTVNSIEEVKALAVPSRALYEELGYGAMTRKVLARWGDQLALIGDCTSATMGFVVCLRGMQQAMMDLLLEPELIQALMEKGTEYAIERGKFNLDSGLKILRLNDSVGNMSVMSPAHWREFIFPHMREVCTELHRYDPEALIYCHICGNVMPILEDLIETGLDCIAPLDPLGGCLPGKVRETVGDRIALMGGVNTLSFKEKSPEQIAEEARVCMEACGRQGGYIVGSGCVVPRGSSRENLEAVARVCRGL